MLSEKAKGKQRAVEPFDDQDVGQGDSSLRVDNTARDILVRFTDGSPDLTVLVDKHSSVKDVKQRIRQARQDLQHRHLRLIHSGRLLTNSILNSWFTSPDQQQQHKSSHDSNGEDISADSTSTKVATTWLHCSVGPVITIDDSEDDELLQKTQIQPIRGFDRLASIGFSQEDIESIRRQFHSQSSANYLDHDFETDEDYAEHARTLEEQWIDSMDNTDSALSQSSTSGGPSLLKGVLVGFFFPLIPFFFMRGQKPAVFWEDGSEHDTMANALFSRRTGMGLVLGFLANILFGMWRYFLYSS